MSTTIKHLKPFKAHLFIFMLKVTKIKKWNAARIFKLHRKCCKKYDMQFKLPFHLSNHNILHGFDYML